MHFVSRSAVCGVPPLLTFDPTGRNSQKLARYREYRPPSLPARNRRPQAWPVADLPDDRRNADDGAISAVDRVPECGCVRKKAPDRFTEKTFSQSVIRHFGDGIADCDSGIVDKEVEVSVPRDYFVNGATAVGASGIARPDTPVMSVAAEDSFIPAPSSSSSSRSTRVSVPG